MISQKILITGANGLLGQKLVQLLAGEKGYEVIATGRGPARVPFHEKVTYFDMDLTGKGLVFEKIARLAPAWIVHCAAISQPDVCETDKELCILHNITATGHLVEAARQSGSKFLFLSTDFVFDGTKGPYVEDDEPNPVNFYGESKYEAEKLLRQSDLHYAIVRTVLVYGVAHSLSRSNIVLWVKNKLEKGEAIRVVNDQWRTPTLVEDLAMGYKLIIDREAMGIYHISGTDYLTPYQLALKTAGVFGLDKKLISPTDASEFREIAKRPLKTGFDISKASEDLGYQPHTIDEGLMIVKGQLEVRG